MLTHRRQLLKFALATGCLSMLPAQAAEESPVSTGAAVPGLEACDEWVLKFLKKHRVPGGQLAIVKGGKLIYSRGFGLADVEAKEPVTPESLFRIASVSKVLTGVAIMQLVEQGKLKLDDKIVDLLKVEPHLGKDAKEDERWSQITVAHCLTHTAGWDRDKSFDPMFHQFVMAKSLGVKLPIGTAEIIRYMRGMPLDFTPGERFAYSNFGFCILGRVIEKLSGQTYEQYVQQAVFAPCGIKAPRIGLSLVDQRAPGEVKYYTANKLEVTPVVGPHAGEEKFPVDLSYGGWQQEVLDSHGGWISSAQDLALFAAQFDHARVEKAESKLLKTATIRDMLTPHTTVKAGDDQGRGRVAMGYSWMVGMEDNDLAKPVYSHGGALPCTASSLIKLHDDINLAVLFNLGQTKSGDFIGRGLDAQLAGVARSIEKWPD